MEQPTPQRGRGRKRQQGRGRAPVPSHGRGRGREPAMQEGPSQTKQAVPQGKSDQGLAQQLLTGLTHLVGEVAGRQQEALDPFTIACQEFRRHQTPRFDGNGDYAALEAWLTDVKGTFLRAHIPVEYWARLAVTCFDKDARHWWSTQQPKYLGDGPNICWEWFTDVLRARFMSESQKEGFKRGLENLVQGALPVRHYGRLFLQLSRYAPDLVADPQQRRDRFIRGLTPDLAMAMDRYKGTTIEYLMDKAELQMNMLTTRDKSRKDKQQVDDGGSRRVALPASRLPVAPPVRQPGVVNASRQGRYFCRRCQRIHFGPCTRRNGRCHICQAIDHWKIDCPFNKNRCVNSSSSGECTQAHPQGDQIRHNTARVHASVGQKNQKTENRERFVRRLDPSG